jgi:glycosyltransferase involved in cell wall biosynthesis
MADGQNNHPADYRASSGEKRRLKFLMLTTFYPPYNFGGDGIYIYRLSNELAKRGHQVDVVHCVDAYEVLEKNGPKGEYPNHPGITVHSLKSRWGFLSPLFTQQTSRAVFKAPAIKALIAEKNFDVIHYHNMSLVGLDTLTYGDAIKFYTMHEHWLVCPMHVLWKYDREPCAQRNCISCQILGKRPLQLWRYSGIMPKALAHIDTFISPSLFTKRKHQEMGLNKPIVHLPYFLPTSANSEESRCERASVHPRPYFLFVGRLEKIKGVQNLIAAFRRYQQCDLLVAGDGEYAPALRELAQDVPNVIFLGRLSYQKLQEVYRNALAVLVSSLCYEVFGIIMIESFAKRTPVIVNNLGALPEVVEQSGGGFIYRDEDELIAHMEKFRLQPELRQTLGAKGYEAYRKFWTEDYHIKTYYDLIRQAAARKHAGHPAIAALQDECEGQSYCEHSRY